MIRRIIQINEEKCNGCGLCADACHEGAIGIVGGKAKLLREDYCDGLGDCLPACPMNAIFFEEREAPAYDEAAVLAAKKAKEEGGVKECSGDFAARLPSHLTNFPVQIKLVPPNASCFDGADLLIVAGTSLTVYPAAGLINYYRGNRLVLINRDATPYDGQADLVIHDSLGNV
ncbi:MAG: 4Fe-4S binding protein, partial [Oscillibacter sp.]|nr:4Fe-4S binding protein [Oscillibacter sp.]